MEILKCEGVRKIFGSGNNQVIALERIDLSVHIAKLIGRVCGAKRPHSVSKQPIYTMF